MVVSRYLVDAIQIGGLIIGTVGFFCLEYHLFGKIGAGLLKRLLAGIVTAIFFAIWLPFFTIILAPSLVAVAMHFFPQVKISASDFTNLALVVPLGAYLGFFYGFSLLLRAERTSESLALERINSVLVFILLVLAMTLLVHFLLQLPWYSAAVLSIGSSLLLGASMYTPVVVDSLPKEHVQRIGVVATLFGIATQFVPPILNALNVTIR